MNFIDRVSDNIARLLANPRGTMENVIDRGARYVDYVSNEYFRDMAVAAHITQPTPPVKHSHKDGLGTTFGKAFTNIGVAALNAGKAEIKRVFIKEAVKAVIVAALVSAVVGAFWWMVASAAVGVLMATFTFVPAAFAIHSYSMFEKTHPWI